MFHNMVVGKIILEHTLNEKGYNDEKTFTTIFVEVRLYYVQQHH